MKRREFLLASVSGGVATGMGLTPRAAAAAYLPIPEVLDRTLAALLEDLDQCGLLNETLVVAVGEFGRSPRLGVSTSGNTNAPDGRDHWPYCYTALIAGAGIKRGNVYGKSDEHASSPVEDPVHPTDLATRLLRAWAGSRNGDLKRPESTPPVG